MQQIPFGEQKVKNVPYAMDVSLCIDHHPSEENGALLVCCTKTGFDEETQRLVRQSRDFLSDGEKRQPTG